MGEKLKTFFEKIKNKISGKAENNLFHNLTSQDEEPLFVPTTKKKPFALEIVFNTIKATIALVFLLGCAVMGLVLGVAKAYVDTVPELDASMLTKSDRTSYIYDMNGKLITTYAGMEYRDWATIDEIPDMLVNALISVEDVRFYKHHGVDYKRLVSAVVGTLTNSNAHGGSTLTQQLVKNKILTNEQSYKRKIQELYLALEVEETISKDQILEAYLNDVFLGESNYGVKTAAKDYFGKELSELTIRECAMLAGMVQKPYETNPRANMYKRKNADGTNKMNITNERTDLVLKRMFQAGCITKQQYESALKEEVNILPVSKQKQLYDMPYFVEYAIYDVITHLLEARNLPDTQANRNAIENEIRTGGYHIYTTVDPEIQHTVQDTITEWDKYPKLENPNAAVEVTTNADGTTIEIVEPQAAAVVIDQSTGQLRAIIGGRTSPERKKEWNRAYQSSMMVGSSIKPLAIYGPALDMGSAPASIIMNMEGPIQGYGGTGYPAIGSTRYIGPTSIRTGIVQSLNVVAARTLFERVGIENSVRYLEALGIEGSRINADGPGLALGTSGITPIEMAGAYATIASGGEYKKPISFTKVVDDAGNVILDGRTLTERRPVFKRSTCYMLVDMLSEAVKSGTGANAQITGMTVAGKTGTNSDYTSVYFAGMTPYYTAVVWIGHDYPANKLVSGSTGGKCAAPLWQAFMSKIHVDLENKQILDGTPEENGLVKRRVCSISGLLATEACENDACGHTPIEDWFDKDSVPTKTCDMHATVTICKSSNKPASEFCPDELKETKSVVLINSSSPYMQFEEKYILQVIPNAVFTDIPVSEYGDNSSDEESRCPVHTKQEQKETFEDMVRRSNKLISEVEDYMSKVHNLPNTTKELLKKNINWLKFSISFRSESLLNRYYDELKANYEKALEDYPIAPPPTEPTNPPGENEP